jgi:putative phage-type endonuclease
MIRETIIPADEDAWLALRVNDLTSTDIPALFGLSPYKTRFEIWHEKRAAERAPFTDNDRAKWGRRLEAVVAIGIAQDQEWAARPMKEYIRLPDVRLGSSFDWRVRPAKLDEIVIYPEPHFYDEPDDAILEIKTVDFLAFRDGWTIDEGFIEAPPHIEIQVQHQMLVSGLRRAYIGVMVGGNRIEVIERLADAAVHAGIIAKAREFWQSIDDGRAPDPVMPDDAEAIIRMHQFAEPGKLLDARGDAAIATLLQEYKRLGDEAKSAEEQRKVVKADLLQIIGDAEKVISDVGTVSAGIVGPAEVAYTREPYRNFRFTPKKTAKAQEAA